MDVDVGAPARADNITSTRLAIADVGDRLRRVGLAIGLPIACFVEIDSKNVIPAEMISIEENVVKNPFAGYNSLEVKGPSFLVNSDKFLITNIIKYIIYSINIIVLFLYSFL